MKYLTDAAEKLIQEECNEWAEEYVRRKLREELDFSYNVTNGIKMVFQQALSNLQTVVTEEILEEYKVKNKEVVRREILNSLREKGIL